MGRHFYATHLSPQPLCEEAGCELPPTHSVKVSHPGEYQGHVTIGRYCTAHAEARVSELNADAGDHR